MQTRIGVIVLMAIGMGGSAFAQQPRSILTTTAGVANTSEATSGAVNLEYGVAAWKNVVVFGGAGRLMNVEPSLAQPAVDATVSSLAANNVLISGQPHTPAWYADGGVRLLIPAGSRVTPYVFTALGVGRTVPSVRFTYQGTTGVSGGTTIVGQDATTDVQSGGYFTSPAGEWGAVMRVGGGVLIPIHKSLAATAGYDFTRLSVATPVNVGSFTFGVGFHF
jgi:hypothetical protein